MNLGTVHNKENYARTQWKNGSNKAEENNFGSLKSSKENDAGLISIKFEPSKYQFGEWEKERKVKINIY